MTSREIFEGMLIELSKVKAPSLLLEDFNYLFNKTIRGYVKRVYSQYDTTLATADSLRVLKATSIILPKKTEAYNETKLDGWTKLSSIQPALKGLYGNVWEFDLPDDYLHMLNCLCVFKLKKSYGCYDAGSYMQFPATRLDSDKWAQIVNDYYNKPSYKRPYYFIHNVNSSNTELTNPFNKDDNTGTDQIVIPATYKEDTSPEIESEGIDLQYLDKASITIGDTTYKDVVDVRQLPAGSRHCNPTKVRCEIRYGKDDSIFELAYVSVDYLKSPQKIRLTPEQLDLTEDTSQIMEFPDHVCQEIINELVMHVMENTADPRLRSNMAVNLTTIVSPTLQLSQTQA